MHISCLFSWSILEQRHLKGGGDNDNQWVPMACRETPPFRNLWGSSEVLVHASGPLERDEEPQWVLLLPLTDREPVAGDTQKQLKALICHTQILDKVLPVHSLPD